MKSKIQWNHGSAIPLVREHDVLPYERLNTSDLRQMACMSAQESPSIHGDRQGLVVFTRLYVTCMRHRRCIEERGEHEADVVDGM